ncbi:MAG: 30S ribosomal protein S6 [Fibrobacterota bacterium]
MNKYETVVVFDGSLPEETIAKEQQAIENAIKESCKLDSVDIWGKKTLAYPIREKKSGFYCLFTYEYDGDANAFISNKVRYNDTVLRSMTVLSEDGPINPRRNDEKDGDSSDDAQKKGDE